MTSTPNEPELLAVIQADREAAAQIVEWQIGTGWEPPFFSAAFPAAIRVGTWDEHDLVQAFARHRLDTRPTPAAVGDVEAELKSWQRECRQEATRANRAEDRFLRGEAVLKSIAANSCCDKCQEAARVAQTYFDAALAQPQPSGGVDEARLPLEKRLRLEYPVGKVDPVDGTAGAWVYRNPDGPEAADRIERLAAEGVKMGEALVSVGIGGNHLALLIGADHPPHTAEPLAALGHYGAGDTYEIWCCWRSIMLISDVIERPSDG